MPPKKLILEPKEEQEEEQIEETYIKGNSNL